LALRSKPICLQRPEGRLPSEVMKEYNQEYEKQEKDLCLSGDTFRNEPEKLIQNVNPAKNNKSAWKLKTQATPENFNNLRHTISSEIGDGTQPSKKQPKQLQKFHPKIPSNLTSSQPDISSDSDEDDEESPHGSMKSIPKEINGIQFETNKRRLETRQRQIDIGMNTPGYQRFIQLVPHPTKGHPQIPNKLQVCSKRSWDGQIRKWRRMLHLYDPDLRSTV